MNRLTSVWVISLVFIQLIVLSLIRWVWIASCACHKTVTEILKTLLHNVQCLFNSAKLGQLNPFGILANNGLRNTIIVKLSVIYWETTNDWILLVRRSVWLKNEANLPPNTTLYFGFKYSVTLTFDTTLWNTPWEPFCFPLLIEQQKCCQ